MAIGRYDSSLERRYSVSVSQCQCSGPSRRQGVSASEHGLSVCEDDVGRARGRELYPGRGLWANCAIADANDSSASIADARRGGKPGACRHSYDRAVTKQRSHTSSDRYARARFTDSGIDCRGGGDWPGHALGD